MLDFVIYLLAGGSSAQGLASSLLWPFVSVPDLIKISALLVATAILQLWARKRRSSSGREA